LPYQRHKTRLVSVNVVKRQFPDAVSPARDGRPPVIRRNSSAIEPSRTAATPPALSAGSRKDTGLSSATSAHELAPGLENCSRNLRHSDDDAGRTETRTQTTHWRSLRLAQVGLAPHRKIHPYAALCKNHDRPAARIEPLEGWPRSRRQCEPYLPHTRR